jgi:hypothetical protein
LRAYGTVEHGKHNEKIPKKMRTTDPYLHDILQMN